MNPRYMLDTNICIYIARQRPPQVLLRFERLKPGQLVMSVITFGELHFGASKSSQSAQALARLEDLCQDVPVEDLTRGAAAVYGKVRARLEKDGRLIGNNDLWIAAHAVSLGVTLVTNNESEFRRIPSLSVENWAR